MNKLSMTEWGVLREHETAIRDAMADGQRAFVTIGEHLAAISENKLYREKYDSFEAYTKDRWGITRQYGYQLMVAAGIFKALPAETAEKVPSMAATMALKAIPASERADVVESASKEGNVSQTALKRASKAVTHEVDETGAVVPSVILPDWQRAMVLGKHLAASISKLKCAVEDGLKNRDAIFTELNNQVVADLVNAYNAVKLVIPYAVCPTCQGRQRDTCRTCGGRGYISKFYFDTKVDTQTKALRERVTQK